MHSHRLKKVIAAFAAAIAVLPVTALGLAVAEVPDFSNNVGTATPPSASPITGTLNYATDADDVFALDLTQGQNVFLQMTGSAGADFDLYLFGPGTTSVNGQKAALAYKETPGGSSERIVFEKVPVTGRYYVNAYAYSGSGSYKISYGFPSVRPSITASASATVKWAQAAKLTGQLETSAHEPVAGQLVYVYGKGHGQADFVKVAQVRTDSLGNYSVDLKPTSATRYQVRFNGSPQYLPVSSAEFKVTPYAYLTRPTAPSTVKVRAGITSVGYLKPRHAAGTKAVKVSCYRKVNGAWALRRTVYATCTNYSSYSKYTVRYSLLYPGEWKIVASVPGDSLHLATSSSARYLTVK